MSYHVPEDLHGDRSIAVIVRADTLPWVPSPQAGVERRFLERQGAEVARATSLVRYAPNSRFSAHVHEMGEEFLVLQGVFSDEQGDFATGAYVRNPPGSHHSPFTRDGCTIFVKLRQMPDDEIGATVRVTDSGGETLAAIPGASRIDLFSRAGVENVGIERLEPGTAWHARGTPGGEEILVLDGVLSYGETPCPPLTWLRIPAGQERALSAPKGCRYWVKRGHLDR